MLQCQHKGAIRASWLALVVILVAVPALAGEGKRGHNVNENGFSSGYSFENRSEHINEGFDVTHRFGHNYTSSWNVGEYSDPIMRKGEVVGERGRKWENISNVQRDWDKTVGDRWVRNRKSWNVGGHNRDFFSGSSRFFQNGPYTPYQGGAAAANDDGGSDE